MHEKVLFCCSNGRAVVKMRLARGGGGAATTHGSQPSHKHACYVYVCIYSSPREKDPDRTHTTWHIKFICFVWGAHKINGGEMAGWIGGVTCLIWTNKKYRRAAVTWGGPSKTSARTILFHSALTCALDDVQINNIDLIRDGEMWRFFSK